MGYLNLVFAIHSHQPVGNFDHVFRKAFDECYGPFIDAVEEFPNFRFAYHLSGPLLEWIEREEPRYLDRLRKLVKRGQLEMLSGGFYEPILASIPTADAIGQLDMMNRFIKEKFDQDAKGFWLTERIWTPELPMKIAPAGLKYTFVDDTHFLYAGLETNQLFGYRFTESEGYKLAIFPGLKELRYSIPFKEGEEVIELLKSWTDPEKDVIVSYADDGEKFGVWPGTYKWVYKKKWLREFLQLLEENSSWLRMILPCEALEKYPAEGRIYMPTASYEEMLKWALPVPSGKKMVQVIQRLEETGLYEESQRFIRGGLWDNFLVKYPESNCMHKKMIFLSSKAGKNKEPLKAIWRAQCNCGYWHGLFGGIYLPHLRHAIYQNLIEAQRILRLGSDQVAAEVFDFDRDGNDEIIWHGNSLNVYLAPAQGGRVFEIDFIPSLYNLTNVLTRREEIYHEEFRKSAKKKDSDEEVKSIHQIHKAKEGNLENWLIYDQYCRGSFLDHFLSADESVQLFWKSECRELGDFLESPYEILEDATEKNYAEVTLKRTGAVLMENEKREVIVEKKFRLKDNRLEVKYLVRAPGLDARNLRFGVEQNYTLHTGSDPQRFLMLEANDKGGFFKEMPGKIFSYPGVSRWEMINEWDNWRLICSSDKNFELWHFPLETVSHSEEGLEKVHQGSCFLMQWPMEMNESDVLEINIVIEVERYA
ncbi:MAG TPA: DUF1926 domain-containing protein [Deltaproteobacteria bacterium]|nr:DUF1926 domain-containing protein [Deltaproteobacteria bacterium]